MSWLTEELVAIGHEVTLFASGDSVTSATLAPMREQQQRRAAAGDPGSIPPVRRDSFAPHYRMIEQVYRRKDEFDVLHSHLDYLPLSLLSRQSVPYLTTLHGRLDLPDYVRIFTTFPDAPFVSISANQRLPLPDLNWLRTVGHGVPAGLLTPRLVTPSYLAFLGRICPEKGVDRAIRVAGRAGMKLKIAAKVDNADKVYYDTVIRPLIRETATRTSEFIGEINDLQEAGVPVRRRTRCCFRSTGQNLSAS